MCISDWRIGRLIRSCATAWNTAGAVNTTFPANRNRVAITISRSGIGLSTTADTIITFTNGAVINLSTAQAFCHLTTMEYGDLVTYGFVITANTTAHTGVTTEYTLPESILTQNLDDLKQQ